MPGCEDDAEAVHEAKTRCEGERCEIWRSAVMVGDCETRHSLPS
ncbi:MAG TPA: hypothetical protein VKQ70_07065 [Caulobacteraceae bacterium]|nr:hypothetical protein [Caulobacteraceae bacterium]